jgi:hypothetical protein
LRPKGHRVKVRAAKRLRAQTTASHEWLAERRRMGDRSNVSNLAYANLDCRK